MSDPAENDEPELDDGDTRPDVGELLALVEQLDADNERLRNKALDLARFAEDAVTAQVAGERRIDELTDRIALLEAEIDALQRTRLMRTTRPLRTAYGRLRSRRPGGR